jgi:hypothetical protein
MSEEEKIKALVSAETQRLVKKIFKHSLMILEDLRFQHSKALEDLVLKKRKDL